MINYFRLWVVTKTDDGYSGKMYGWSRNKKYRYTEALLKRDELMREEHVHSVDIIEA